VTLFEHGVYDEALAMARQLLTWTAAEPQHWWRLNALTLVGRIELLLGHLQPAERALRSAIAIAEREPNRVGVLAILLSDLSVLYTVRGESERALGPAERALALTTPLPGPETPKMLVEVRFALGRVLWESGKDRLRARRLASEARAGVTERMPRRIHLQAEAIDRWLASHTLRGG
jgi:hypothetical protein